MLPSYMIWNSSPIFLQLGIFALRWYGMLWALSFLLGLQILFFIYKKEGKPLKDIDALFLHTMLGTMIGARLGHVLFYDFPDFLQHPLEIFLPVVFEPTFKFVGYRGLASHGASLGILLAVYIYVNKIIIRLWPPRLTIKNQHRVGQSYLWVFDRLVIVVALGGCLIRIGNFMNSEIVGRPTHSQYGVLFVHDATQQLLRSNSAIASVEIAKSNTETTNDSSYLPVTLTVVFNHGSFEEKAVRNFLEQNIKDLLVKDYYVSQHIYETEARPLSYTLSKNRRGAYVAHIDTLGIARHPAVLYEAFSCLVLFLLLFCRWYAKKSSLKSGEMFGLFLVIVFGLRIFYELLKQSKIVFAGELITLRMPQLLSLPLVIVGILLLVYSRRPSKITE